MLEFFIFYFIISAFICFCISLSQDVIMTEETKKNFKTYPLMSWGLVFCVAPIAFIFASVCFIILYIKGG